MKKLFVFLFVLMFVGLSQAQWVVESFDNAVGPVYLDPPVLNDNFFASGTNPKMDLFNESDHMEGTGSMKVDYKVEASEGWGGYTVRRTYTDAGGPLMPDIDLSTGTHLKLRYKVVTPADTTQEGSVFMELKPAEYGGDGSRELWNHHMQIDMFDASGTWKEVLIPLVVASDNNFGFSIQSGSNDDILSFDKIKAFELTCVYITSGNPATPPTATGVILLDKLELVGNKYNPFQTFDNAATDVFTTDYMSWAGTGASAIALSNNTTDFVEGTGSMQLDYTVNASQSWGGYLNMTDTTWAFPDSFTNRTALVLFVKNVNPITGATPKRVTFRFFLMENNTGANEDWVIEIPVNFEEAGEWTRYYLPLKQDTVWTDSAGKTRFPQTGFAQTWWSITGDNKFNQESITGYKIEFSAGGNDYGPQNETFTGRILFDVLQQSGFKYDDKVAPDAPVVNVIPSSYTNLITWLDVPGENGESYSVYYSANPITDVEADGVDILTTGLVHGTQVFEHVLRSANIDRPREYYYAVVCKDFAGNIGPAGVSGKVINNARGVTTVSINPPAAFVADGNLGEWSAITPFVMQSALGTANVVLNISGDADCSAEVKVAVDNDYLYVMLDVTDDVFNHPLDINPWERDELDLYIGLYNLVKSHVAYGSGANADYQIRFDSDRIRVDAVTDCDSLVLVGPNYYFGEKFPAGYIAEAKIPLVDLATKRNFGQTSTDVINWKAGDRIPFDIGINDNDGSGREGMIFYSPTNGDQGYQNVSRWTYTWIGDEVVGVDDNIGNVNTFELLQNYPNPFNPSTRIQYSIAEPGLVSIKVFDILGRQIADLVNSQQSAGTYTVDFNAQNLSAGVYFYKIDSGSFQASKKMILLK